MSLEDTARYEKELNDLAKGIYQPGKHQPVKFQGDQQAMTSALELTTELINFIHTHKLSEVASFKDANTDDLDNLQEQED